jgi:hypothetical protein
MYSKEFFGSTDPNFNLDAAVEAYEFVKEDPEYARALLGSHINHLVSKVLIEEPEIIDTLIRKKYEDRKAVLTRTVANSFISKSMNDEQLDEISKVMDEISKDYTAWERRQNVNQQRRGPGGRFVDMGTTHVTDPRPEGGHDRERDWAGVRRGYDQVYQQRWNGRPPTVPNNERQNARHSAAYLEIREALANVDPTALVLGTITMQDGAASYPIERIGRPDHPEDFIRESDFSDGKYVRNVKWGFDENSAFGGGYDLLTGAGISGQDAMYAAGLTGRSTTALGNYSSNMQKPLPDDEYGTSGYRKLTAAATLAEDLGGDDISGKAKFALKAAKYIGENGTEAEKIIGPSIRRSAYRYRGTEKKPDAKLERALAMSVNGAKSVDDAREKLIHPSYEDAVGGSPDNPRYEQDLVFSPFIRYWMNQLPKREILNLQLASGAVAPSQGVILDSKGQIVTQAVGYGDDHFLPFNLKNLSRSNRGEWIRTRTMGGPTTEDINAALLTGTRSITVVSHSGVFNVEFDNSFRGGRRGNDKARRMVRRYAQLLDTLNAKNTVLQSVPADRRDEIDAQVKQEIRGTGQVFAEQRKTRSKELYQLEKENPTPSAAQRQAWAEEFATDVVDAYSDSNKYNDQMTWSQVKAQIELKQHESDKAASGYTDWDRRQGTPEPEKRHLTDEEAFAILGKEEQYKKFVKFKERDYKASQQPLELNGQGYYTALQALQEQFPYYIKRVEWYPPNEAGGSPLGRDKGYVKPNYIRPSEAKEGYWDPSIEGFKGQSGVVRGEKKTTGKVNADQAYYQNFNARERVKEFSRTETPAAPVADAAAPAAGATPAAQAAGGAPVATAAPFSISRYNGIVFGNRFDGGVRHESAQSVNDLINLGDDMANQAVQFQTAQGGTATAVFGVARNSDLPLLTDWTTTKDRIRQSNDDEVARLAESIRSELTLLFDSTGGSAQLSGFRNSLGQNAAANGHTTAWQQIKDRVPDKPTTVAQIASVNNRAKDFDWTTSTVDGAEFLEGRSVQQYDETEARDPDIRRLVSRFATPSASDILDGVIAANDSIRAATASSDPNATVTYLNREYARAEFPELANMVGMDAIGAAKFGQLGRRRTNQMIQNNPLNQPQAAPVNRNP